MLQSRVLAGGGLSMLILTLTSAVPASAAEKLQPEQLVKLHLEEGLGPGEARARARVVRGRARLRSRAVGEGELAGSFQLASDAAGQRLFVQFGTNAYEGETFAFDGKGVEVGFGQRPTGQRSVLGTFVSNNPVILREGLLGGVLNAAWPLASLEARQPKLSSDGLKKLDGRALHRLTYRARKGGQNELTVHLYFEPETFRHVATVYSASRAQSMGATPAASSQESDEYYRLEERFSDFERVMDLALPKKWALRYEISKRTTSEWVYELEVGEIEPR